MANIVFNSFKFKAMAGSIDLVNNTIKVALVTEGYTPDQDSHQYFDDVTNELPTGNGYVAGGQTIAGQTLFTDNTDNEAVADGDDVTWPDSTIEARYAIMYISTGDPATSPLIACIDFGSNKETSAQDFVIEWNSEGFLNASDPA